MDRYYTFHFISLLFTIGILDRIEVVIADDKDKKYHINELSEGEQQLVTLSAIKSVFSQDNTVIFLDEPDAFLHPQRQREIIPHLKEIFSKNVPQLFVTTHSPFVAQSIDLENVIVFKSNGKSIKSFDIDLDSIGAITDELFGISSEFSVTVEKAFDSLHKLRSELLKTGTIRKEKLTKISEFLYSQGEEVKIVTNRELNQLIKIKPDLLDGTD